MPHALRITLLITLALTSSCDGSTGGTSDLAAPADIAVSAAADLGGSKDLAMSGDSSAPLDMATSDLAAAPLDLAHMADFAGASEPCTAGGATVGMQLCCGATNDFPNLCGIGACGCSPMNSHMVRTCMCPGGKCWNGNACQ